ncbi:hypothetical protein AAGS39_16160 [Flavobacterium sp. CGRL2]
MNFLQNLSRYRFSRYSKFLFVCWDLLLLNFAIYLSAMARFGDLDKLFFKRRKNDFIIGEPNLDSFTDAKRLS